jgi:integrase
VLAVYWNTPAVCNRAAHAALSPRLRTQDVISLCLDDIDWADGRLDLRPGKTRRARSLPPTGRRPSGGGLRASRRPRSASRQVFLRCRPPFQPLTNSAVWWMVRQALQHAGITTRPGIASHIFRHTAASQMLNHGASFKGWPMSWVTSHYRPQVSTSNWSWTLWRQSPCRG